MKNSLLALAAMALMSQTAYSMYLIGEPAGQWNPNVGIEMEAVEGGWQWTGTIGASSYFAFATQLDPSEDWANFNANYRLSPEKDSEVACEGEFTLHLGAPDAAFKGCGAECTFLLSQKGDSYSLKITQVSEPISSWGLVGDFNNWGYDSGNATDIELTCLHEDMWTVFMPSMEGDFKFRANHDWAINYGCPYYEAITESGIYPASKEGSNFKIDKAENVLFFFQPDTYLLTVRLNAAPATPLALRGNMNNWNWDPEYCFTKTETEGVYSLHVDMIEAGSAFKISDLSWNNQYTSQFNGMLAGQPYEMTVNDSSSANMAFEETYHDVTFTLDTTNNTLTAIADSSAVGTVGVSESAPVYYNLQGVRVDNPENGIFIRVAGGKTVKVLK